MLDTETFKDYATLYKEKQALESRLSEVKELLNSKESILFDNLLENDMEKISIAGKTIYQKINTFAVIPDKKKAIEVLKENGYDDFIKEGYNTNSISKLVRDLIAENGELPEEFGDAIQVGKAMRLGVTNA